MRDLSWTGPPRVRARAAPCRAPASYIVRQLVDIQNGNRNGHWTALMKPVVAKLTVSDMVSIAAYTASLKP